MNQAIQLGDSLMNIVIIMGSESEMKKEKKGLKGKKETWEGKTKDKTLIFFLTTTFLPCGMSTLIRLIIYIYIYIYGPLNITTFLYLSDVNFNIV